MKSLYSFKYFNKYYKEELQCEFRASNIDEAKQTASERCNYVDSKYITENYLPEDFTLFQIDDTYILETKRYKTRSGLRVEISNINKNSTTIHNSVSGKVFFLNNKGEEKKRGSYFMWSMNGRFKGAGKDELDLVEE